MKQDEEDIISSLGCLYASVKERLGEATRTELFRCRNCNSYTRFPRYNKALWVTSMRRGRCGEYSMLLYRMLRSVGYEKIRYVVDWADHLWVEIWLGDNVGDYATAKNGRWVHCDPCEATVDEPLLYVSWNKIPTYIFAFRVVGIQMEIEDVTMHYTTDNIQAIHKRRGISSDFVTESIREVSDKSSDILRELRTTKK
jgi:peptide-N4-(N-acetyl-beta-glucosaminyl)asparagine amidase